MPDATPLQKLDDAIHEFFATLDDEAATETLTGWVLGYQFSFIEDNGPDTEPIVWGAGYSIAPGMSPFAADRVLAHVRRVISDVYAVTPDGDR